VDSTGVYGHPIQILRIMISKQQVMGVIGLLAMEIIMLFVIILFLGLIMGFIAMIVGIM
jgi:hypothetical protein